VEVDLPVFGGHRASLARPLPFSVALALDDDLVGLARAARPVMLR